MAIEAVTRNAIGRITGRNLITEGAEILAPEKKIRARNLGEIINRNNTVATDAEIRTPGNQIRARDLGGYNRLEIWPGGESVALRRTMSDREAGRVARGKRIRTSIPIALNGGDINEAHVSIRRGPLGVAGRTQIRYKA